MTYSKKPVFRSALDFDSRSLALCLETIAEQNQLLSIVGTALPTSIAEHVNHCVLSGNCLLIYTESAAWASQIRFFQQAILSKLHDSGQAKITLVRIKVFSLPREPETGRKVQMPSPETVRAMAGLADQKSDDVLDVALANLANTLRKRLES